MTNIHDTWTNKIPGTIVSCFPTNEPLREEGSSSGDDLDIMASAITNADLASCEDMVDLLALLAQRSIKRIFEVSNGNFVDILSIYRWAAADKVCDIIIIFTRHICWRTSVTS